MTRTSYKTLQRAIARDDMDSIVSRWEYGRTILADPKKMAASGKSLRHGAMEALIADATAVGTTLTDREVQRRIQCARTYKSINEIRRAAADFADWRDLADAGFPVTFVDDVPSPEALLDDIEATDPQEFEQLELFPSMVKSVPLTKATLRHLRGYAEEMREMTASFGRRDSKRFAHLDELEAAMDGNRDALYVDALAALNAAKAAA